MKLTKYRLSAGGTLLQENTIPVAIVAVDNLGNFTRVLMTSYSTLWPGMVVNDYLFGFYLQSFQTPVDFSEFRVPQRVVKPLNSGILSQINNGVAFYLVCVEFK